MYELIRAGERTYYIDCPVKSAFFFWIKAMLASLMVAAERMPPKKHLKFWTHRAGSSPA